jgi:DNA replication and repair protein RecF
LDVELPRGPLLFVGDNAQGKTSLLEAVYFLATFTSFHASHERQLINFYAIKETMPVARIVGQYTRGLYTDESTSSRSHRLEARIIQEENGNGATRVRKEILLDGVKKKMGEALGDFNAAIFLPQMLRIIEGAPEDRRRYLNLAMVQALPNYGEILSQYHQVLSRRNALLKALNERSTDPGNAATQLAYWDEQLAAMGAQIMHARIQVVHELERLAASFHRELTQGQEVLRLSYQPSFEPLPERPNQLNMRLNDPRLRSGLSLTEIQDGFRNRLTSLRSEEISRGVTAIGPHRDEIRFLANQMDLGTFGSRGQARTAVLALKLAEVAWMKRRTGEWPVLLLDEVAAELDPTRRSDLLAHLNDGEQVLMTTTDLEPFSQSFLQTVNVWQIQAGSVLNQPVSTDQ